MSPIGRVFIVINLLLAGTFVGFAGTYLQKQHTYKQLLEAKSDEFTKAQSNWSAERQGLTDQINKAEVAKSALDNQLSNARNRNAELADENKRLSSTLASIEGDVKTMSSNANAMRSELAAMANQAKEAYAMAIADQKAKDAAVREKDDAVAKLRDANFKISGLEETVAARDQSIAGLTKDKSELQLLVDVAGAKGFLPIMAVPPLAGTVSHVSGRLVTISVTDNATNAEIKPGYSFALYEAGTYKGEAKVTEAADGIAFCTVDKAVDGTTIKVGDRAATQTR